MPLSTQFLVQLGLNVLGGVLILLVGWSLARWLEQTVQRLSQRNLRIDRTLAGVLARVTRAAVLIVTVIAVLNRFGVETTSIIALLGAAGLAVGLALQGALSNVAAGVLLLLLRPFKVGDAVDIGGVMGIVTDIGLFVTHLNTFDNVAVHMPNAQIYNGPVKNLSQNPTRRLELLFSISYEDDIDTAIRVIREVLAADPCILAEPAAFVGVSELADSSVNLLVWPWVALSDFLMVKLELNQRIKERLEAEGLSIPFPQRDVHLIAKGKAGLDVEPVT